MPDEVSVQISMREGAENLAAVRELRDMQQGVIERMESSIRATDEAARAMSDAVTALNELGGRYDGGSVSGMNTSLLPDSVAQNGGDNGSVGLLSELLDEIAGRGGLLGEFVKELGAAVESGGELDDVFGKLYESMASGASGIVEALGDASRATVGAADGLKFVGAAASSGADAVTAHAEAVRDAADGVDDMGKAVDGAIESLDDLQEKIDSVEAGGGSVVDDLLPTDEGGSGKLADTILKKVAGRFDKTGILSKLDDFGVSIEGLSGGARGLLAGFGELEGAAGMAGGATGAAGALGGIASAAAPVAAALAAIPMVIGAVAEGIDMWQGVRDVSISQTGDDKSWWLAPMEGVENWANATFTGLDENETQAIQSTLINNRAAFGSNEYKEGYGFAEGARTNYGLEADKAANLYARAVMRGTMTVGELNSTLETLSETSKETGETMSQLTDSYMSSVEKLSSIYGGGIGADMASSLSTLGLTGEQQDNLTALIGQYQNNSHYGSTFSQMVTDYSNNQGMDMGSAAAAAAIDMTMQGYGGRDQQELVYQPLGDSGESLNGLWQRARESGDFSEMKEVLWDLYRNNAGQYLNVAALLQKSGLGNGASSTPDDIAADFERLFNAQGRGATIGEDGEVNTNVDSLEKMTREWDWDWGRDGLFLGRIGGTFASGGEIGRTLNENDMEKAISGKIAEDGWENDSQTLDSALSFMIHEGVASTDDFKGITENERYKMMRGIIEGYQEQGGDDWMNYVREHKDELSGTVSDYIGQLGTAANSKERQELAAEITVKFEGELGEYLVAKSTETKWKQKNDEGLD